MTLGVEVGFMRYRGLRTGLVIGNGEEGVLTYLTDDQFESTFDGEKDLMMMDEVSLSSPTTSS